jgi:hypothetical protein
MMTRRRWWLVLAAVLAAAGLAVGLSLALTGGGGGGAPRRLTHDDYKQLWAKTHVGEPKKDVLAQWPAPYQHYVDNLKDDCYEWSDRVPGQQPLELYNLCFRNGVLRLKALF